METRRKPPCAFGVKCYRKNPEHFEKYSHLDKSDEFNVTSDRKTTAISNSRTRMRQTTLSFPKKCEFSSAANANNEGKQELPGKNQNDDPLRKNNKNESVVIKRKRENSYSEKKSKAKVKISRRKTKRANCFTSNDSSCDIIMSSEQSDFDCGAVQSTSWVFLKNQSSDGDCSLEMSQLINKSHEEKIKTLFLVDMPSDFYSFYEFCKSLNENNPEKALEICNLKLIGPFDVFSDKINYSLKKESYLCHWRFYYDPPEFQSVLASESGFHFGYWRDDPKENVLFLASNDSEKNSIFKIESENIFGTVLNYLNNFIKNCDPFKKVKVKELKDSLIDWANKNNFTLEKKTKKMAEREKKVVSKCFHGLGIVVPVEAKTKVGYRPLIESNANLKKICGLIMKAENESEKESLWENLQPLITAANIANDECDFGNSLELGINLFCLGSPIFHDTIEYLLSTAYSLLKRTEFEEIIKAHLKLRRKGNQLSVFHK